jgi:hypothetical protein
MLEMHVIAHRQGLWAAAGAAVAHGTLTCTRKACSMASDDEVKVLLPSEISRSAVNGKPFLRFSLKGGPGEGACLTHKVFAGRDECLTKLI